LTIGQVAREAGVNVETIRYYQRRGLIQEPAKPGRGFRRYPPETVARILFIKRAQNLGFTLREIAELLSLGEGRCQDVYKLAQRRYSQVERQIADLRAMKRALRQLLVACEENAADARCPIVESLVAPDGRKESKA